MAILIVQGGRIENLSSREKVDSAEIELWLGKNSLQYLIQDLFVHAEWRRTTTHAHRSAFGFGRRIDANGDLSTATQVAANCSDSLGFGQRFHVDLTDALREHQFEFRSGFSRSGE